MSNLFAFDFDGVVVDSARETGLAAHKTLTELKLDIGAERDVDEVLGAFVRARPVLETGWEAVRRWLKAWKKQELQAGEPPGPQELARLPGTPHLRQLSR